MQVSRREDGLYWPDSDLNACYTWTHTEIASVDQIVAACDRHHTMIHAGANVGAYALKFSQTFQTVYAFEPDRCNFMCLTLNTLHVPNIYPLFAALGAQSGTVRMYNPEPANCGTVAVSHKSQTGNTPMMQIDHLNLQHVSCIHLDLEGYELFALQGAQQTIARCNPIVVVEWLNHGAQYGYQLQDVQHLLYTWGYTLMKPVGSDMMFKQPPATVTKASDTHVLY
jgi:FkbM family methyltransferase